MCAKSATTVCWSVYCAPPTNAKFNDYRTGSVCWLCRTAYIVYTIMSTHTPMADGWAAGICYRINDKHTNWHCGIIAHKSVGHLH